MQGFLIILIHYKSLKINLLKIKGSLTSSKKDAPKVSMQQPFVGGRRF